MKAAPPVTAAVIDVRRRTGALLGVVVLAHVILISTQVNTRTGRSAFDAVVFGVFGEAQRLVASLSGSVSSLWARYVALRGVREENAALRAQLSTIEIRLQEQRALALRAERLQALLDLRQTLGQRTVAAQIIAGDATAYFRTVTIDRGTNDGVATDAAVISPRGVVGRVVGHPAARAARVQLLVDRNAGIGAVIERSRAGGVVVGDEGQMLRMEYVSNLADVRPGDLVVSSGLDGIYPKGFVIGEVVSAERGAGLYHAIRLRPAVDFSTIEEVLVLLDPPAGATDANDIDAAGTGGGA
ncbi:MAG: rod shape-determining protein MreC [Acidobacteria bacterium]|nr:rod shape-determining protein MreC [Acidobacteriota bacterium]